MIANQAFCFVSVYLYNTHTKEVKGDDAEEENVIVQNLWSIVSSLLFLSMLCFGIFMALINNIDIRFIARFQEKHFYVKLGGMRKRTGKR